MTIAWRLEVDDKGFFSLKYNNREAKVLNRKAISSTGHTAVKLQNMSITILYIFAKSPVGDERQSNHNNMQKN